MAVIDNALSEDLASLHTEMADSPMSTEDYNDKMAQIISKQIKTAAVPSGSVIVSVAGQATGTPNMSEIKVN